MKGKPGHEKDNNKKNPFSQMESDGRYGYIKERLDEAEKPAKKSKKFKKLHKKLRG